MYLNIYEFVYNVQFKKYEISTFVNLDDIVFRGEAGVVVKVIKNDFTSFYNSTVIKKQQH